MLTETEKLIQDLLRGSDAIHQMEHEVDRTVRLIIGLVGDPRPRIKHDRGIIRFAMRDNLEWEIMRDGASIAVRCVCLPEKGGREIIYATHPRWKEYQTLHGEFIDLMRFVPGRPAHVIRLRAVLQDFVEKMVREFGLKPALVPLLDAAELAKIA